MTVAHYFNINPYVHLAPKLFLTTQQQSRNNIINNNNVFLVYKNNTRNPEQLYIYNNLINNA